MNKEQIKNIIIGLVVVLLLLGGLFYFTKDKEDTESQNTNTATSSEQENLENLDISDANDQISLSFSTNESKFTTAMNNARTAFGKGEYAASIGFYTEALTYKRLDVVYSGMYVTYAAQNDWVNAKIALDTAISINPLYTEYWNWKIDLLDEKTNTSYQDLKNIYNEALLKVDPKTKINLVTHFARIAENNNQKNEAINVWKYAAEIYPENAHVYQSEIDRLQQSL